MDSGGFGRSFFFFFQVRRGIADGVDVGFTSRGYAFSSGAA